MLVVPLADALDFWARAELAARVADTLAATAAELARHKPPVLVGWREPIARVADDAPHRARLLARQAADLRVVLGAPPERPAAWVSGDLTAEVEQVPVSLDEVRATLV